MKKISMLLGIIMLFTMFQSAGNIAYAEVPYSNIILASGMSSAMGLSIGPDDKIYISDYSGSRIYRMNKDGSNLETVTTNVFSPVGIAFDNSGNLIVAEHSGKKVVKIDSSGNRTVIKDTSGLLTGLAVDSHNNIFVVDYAVGKIYKMKNDGSNFETFATITINESVVTSSLIGLAIDTNDNLYISDRSHSRIIKIDPSGNTSDFANISSPYWVSLGKDGQIYGSSGDRTIQKFDLSGNILKKYATGTYSPWGTQVDIDGSIYFVSAGSTVNRILGYAETIDRRHVKINLLYDLVNGPLDPSAFTLTGVNSNPQVTDAAVDNSEIILTLNSNIEYTDTNVKVNYTKTGTHNIIQQGTSNEITDFANLSVVNNVIGITSVGTLSSINVDHGTSLNNIGLPTTVTVNLSNSTTTGAAISWDGATPAYDGNTSGIYTFSGTLSLPSDVFNPENIEATVDVIVSEAPIPTVTTMGAISVITVPHRTDLSDLGLPTTVSVGLSNSTTTGAAVSWDGGTPVYDGNTAGTYEFLGTIAPSHDYVNPNNLKANAQVVVENARPSSNKSNRNTSLDNPNDNSIVVVNGVEEKVASETKTVENGKSKLEISINNNALEKVISALLEDSSTSQTSPPNLMNINIQDTTADSTVLGLNGETVKQLAQNKFNILINLGHTRYRIPAEELDVDVVANKLSVNNDNLKSIQFFIEVNTFTDEEESNITRKVRDNNGSIVIKPTEFLISAVVNKSDGDTETLQITSFKQYVAKIFEIPNDINPADITTGIVFDQDNNYNQVPTRIYTENRKTYAEINSLTNSIYSVISNPVSVSSVKEHWSEPIINDLASRLIITNYATFEADENVTRGEFATYMIRALGLYTHDTDLSNTFPDVDNANENAIGISLARQWGLINGYDDRMFKPNNGITREEAMVIIAKAMKITDYEGISGTSTFKIESNETLPNWSKPYIQKVLDGQIFIGRSEDNLALKQNITHAETLTALRNLLIKAELINDK